MLLVPILAILLGLLIQAVLRGLELDVERSLYLTLSQAILILFALLKVSKKSMSGTRTKGYFGREEALLVISIGAALNGALYLILDYVRYLEFMSSWSQYYNFFLSSFFRSLGIMAVLGYASCVIGIGIFCLRPFVNMFFKWWFDLNQPPSSSTSPSTSPSTSQS